MPDLNYTPPTTIDRFHISPKFVRGIRGPVGSAKTTGCIMELFARAHSIMPCRDGVRRFRALAIRNTYSELKSTTIKSFEEWLGPKRGFPRIVYDTPITWRYKARYSNEPDLEMEVYFLALDRPEDVAKLKSLETTIIWLNEASELAKAVLDMSTARVGRYPSKMDAPDGVDLWPSHYGVIMDTNSMDDDHWWYALAEVEKPPGFEFFSQPGGLEDAAENLENLPGGRAYYDRMMSGKSQQWIDCFVHCKYTSVADGRPVWPEFNHNIHVSRETLAIYRGLPLWLGHDYGLTPATVAFQVSPRGQVRVLREWCVWESAMGIRQFTENVVRPAILNEFKGMELNSYGDPGGAQRAQTDERTAIEVQSACGVPTNPGMSNLFTQRRDGVAHYLTRMVDGEPALLIDPSCRKLIKGMNGHYRFKRKQVSGEERYTDVPEKNMYSHVCEALQYPMMELVGGVATRLSEVVRATRSVSYEPVDGTYGY